MVRQFLLDVDGGEPESEEGVHAICSASSSKRWLNCTPSARLQLRYPSKNSIYAQEGTYVHSLCEFKLKSYYHLEDNLERPYDPQFHSMKAENNSFIFEKLVIDEEKRLTKAYGNAQVLVEERLDFSNIVPDGFGTGDAVVVSSEELHIFDYKNGEGVFVEADHNTQMMLYALGAINMFDNEFKTIYMTIVQPNLDNIKTFTMSKDELVAWGNEIKPIAEKAYKGEGESVPGEWCTFCAARYDCRARMNYWRKKG